MTNQEKIEALARMEGKTAYDDRPDYGFTNKDGKACLIPPYLTSHDALQPLLEKMTEEEWLRFGNLILGKTGFHNRWFHPKPILLMSPEQKANCILTSCGKWRE